MTWAQNAKDNSKQNKYVMDLLALIFGSDENVWDFMNAVAKTHKGVCESDVMLGEIKQMLEAINAKNS